MYIILTKKNFAFFMYDFLFQQNRQLKIKTLNSNN